MPDRITVLNEFPHGLNVIQLQGLEEPAASS